MAYAYCCQLGIGTCGSCQRGPNATLPTGVITPTAHLGRHGNRDEHNYLCPEILWLCSPDKLWARSLPITYRLSYPFLVLLLCFLYLFTFSSLFSLYLISSPGNRRFDIISWELCIHELFKSQKCSNRSTEKHRNIELYSRSLLWILFKVVFWVCLLFAGRSTSTSGSS